MNSPIHCSLHRSITLRCKEAWEAEGGWDKKEDLWYEKRIIPKNIPKLPEKTRWPTDISLSNSSHASRRPGDVTVRPPATSECPDLWLNHPRINRKESPRVWQCYAKYFLSVRNRAQMSKWCANNPIKM